MSNRSRMLDDGRRLMFGWDSQLASFFATVFNPEAETERGYVLFSVGCGLAINPSGGLIEDSIRSEHELARQLAEYGTELTADEITQLHKDKLEEGHRVTPFQQQMMDMMSDVLDIERLPRDEA